jgi:hypothetical protein
VAIAERRRVRPGETGHGTVLYPAIAEAAHRVGANAIGLIDVGCSAGLNLTVDRAAIAYSNGQSLGDPSSAVQMSCSIVGDRPASGHSILGVAVFRHATLHTEAVGRCWSRGRLLSWLTDS